MGNTIQYYGEALDPEDVGRIIVAAEAYCEAHSWSYEVIDEEEFTIWLDCGEEGMKFFTAVGIGVIAKPHSMCEPLPIVFRHDGRMAGCVKTQFAPLSVHKDITALLNLISNYLNEFDVSDETGYWETGSEEELAAAMEAVADKLMEQHATGEFEGPVVEPSGRIIDLRAKTAASAGHQAGKQQGWISSVFTKLRKTA
jgi:hypothetical protein